MSNYKTEAIVLKTYDFNEADKIIVLYSKDCGLIRAVAKGIKSPKSRIGAKLEPAVCVELLMFKGRNLDIINQCQIIEPFKGLRKCLKKLTIAMYYTELTTNFGIEHDFNAELLYKFLFNSLKELELNQNESLLEDMLVRFEYNLISFAGYAPRLDSCSRCNEPVLPEQELFLQGDLSSIVCNKCLNRFVEFDELSGNLYQYLIELGDKSAKSCNVDNSVVLKSHNIILQYIEQKTSHKLKTPKLLEEFCLS